MVAHTPSTGDPSIDDVVKALEVLPDDQHAQMLELLHREGLTPAVRRKVTDLIDAQVQMEGGLAAIDQEDRELTRVQGEIGRSARAVALPPEEYDAAVQDELATENEIYQQWFGHLDRIERRSANLLEMRKKQDEQSQANALRKMLYGQGSDPENRATRN